MVCRHNRNSAFCLSIRWTFTYALVFTTAPTFIIIFKPVQFWKLHANWREPFEMHIARIYEIMAIASGELKSKWKRWEYCIFWSSLFWRHTLNTLKMKWIMKWANWVDCSLWPAGRLAHTSSFHSFSRLFVCLFSCLVYLRIRCNVYCSIAWRVSKSTARRSCNLRASKTTKINKMSNVQKTNKRKR